MITCKHNRCYAFAAYILILTFLLPAFSYSLSAQNDHIVCFVYHRFGDDRYPSTNISTDVFREQLAYLKQNNFTVWTMGNAVNAMKRKDLIPPRTVVLTIDDAYLSFYESGLPILEEFGYPATLYINTANVGNPDFLSWQQILDSRERGIEIGNHSNGHLHFLDISSDEERESQFSTDLLAAQFLFEEQLGDAPLHYSYPYGEYDEVMEEILIEEGFESAAAQHSGVLSGETDLLRVPRFPMGGPFASLKGFIQKSQMHPICVISKLPEQIVMQENPPAIEITIKSDCIEVENLQCFVNGQRNCITEMQEGPDYVRVRIVSRDMLSGRRSLYTITAPAKDGKGWCWYSHVWVNPDIPEE